MIYDAIIAHACELAGIEPSYTDAWGKHQPLSHSTQLALLEALGFDVADSDAFARSIEAFENRSWRRTLAPLLVIAEEPHPIRVPFVERADQAADRLCWRLDLEDGAILEGNLRPSDLLLVDSRTVDGHLLERREIAFDINLPRGYHHLTLVPTNGSASTSVVAVVPDECYLAPALERGERIWGVSVQLYALRSRRNWGIGDFTDLRRFVEIVARLGGGAIGLNPLHALFPEDPERASPYSPASRRFRNLLYVDVGAIPDFRDCAEARARVGSDSFQDRLAALRAVPLVDYAGVAACKLEILEILYPWFRAEHLSRGTRRARAFRRFQERGGRELEFFATYHVLAEELGAGGRPNYDWRTWPQDFRRPDSPEVAAFIEQQRQRVEYFIYLVWQTETQFRRAVRHCHRFGMPVGIYQDLALAADPSGADAWMDQDKLAPSVVLGAPPDEMNLRGQVWGLPPYNPSALGERGGETFVCTLRANMQHGGALRIDHVLGLVRQFWVPENGQAADGGYVRNPFDTLLGLIALESHRNRCVVIGEDLGTLPHGLRERLRRACVLSYRLLYFERDEAGGFVPPERYPSLALAAIGTHDLPPFAGWWTGHDLDVRVQLQLFPLPEQEADWWFQRQHDRRVLLQTLSQAGFTVVDTAEGDHALPIPSYELVEAAYAYLARSPSLLLMVHLEDVLGVLDQVNVPGTVDEHPNWRRKLPIELHRLSRNAQIASLARRLRDVRPPAAAT